MNRVVIIGGGQAGGWAAKTLRDEGYTGSIALVGEESHPPYERPPLSKAVLAGAATPESARLFKDALFDGLRIDWHRGRHVVSLDRSARRVRLDDGADVGYDKLLFCTGGRARPLAVAGTYDAPVYLLRSIEDALALGAQLVSRRRLLVVGAGWIGLEVAATARGLGVEVHVVEVAGRPCARVLPAEVSERLLALHRRHGVVFSLGTTLDSLDGERGGPMRATLGNGEVIEADCVTAGLGMIANDDLARAADIDCRNGVVVDARCMTSDPHVYAAGDVAVSPNRWATDAIRLESWQNAQDQGIAAAKSMLGRGEPYDPLPRFWSDQYDVNVQIAGLPTGGDRVVFREHGISERFIAFVLNEKRVRAAIGFNAGRDMRHARRLVENAAEASERLSDPAADLAKL